MVNANGYHNTRTKDGWRLTHHIVAEEKLGRPLEPYESVRFKDNDRSNLDPENLEILTKGGARIRKRLAVVEDRIRELQAERNALLRELRETSD